jgi:hypothetical protein
MKYFFILLTSVAIVGNSAAQTAEDSVKAVIKKMFTAMKNADAEMLMSTFSDSIVFQSIGRNKEGKLVVRNESPVRFAEQVNKATPNSLDEQITFDIVKTDGPLAIAWTPYRFYLNGRFSHCGVNSFQLVRNDSEWKIQYIIDTRRKQDCNQ